MTDIRITPAGRHDYGVTVVEGETITDHKVRVTDDFLDALAMPEVDEERLVRESVGFLLERKKATGLYEEFELDVIADQYPDEFFDELRTRLA